MTGEIEQQETSDQHSPNPRVPPPEPPKVGNEQDSKDGARKRDWVPITINIIMVVITGLLAYTNYCLLDAVSKQTSSAQTSAQAATDMAVSMKQSTQATLDAVSIADSANSISKQSLRIQLQPYPNIQVRHNGDIVYVSIKNFGQTPAIDLKGGISIDIHIRGSRVYINHFSIAEVTTLGTNESYVDSFAIPEKYRLPIKPPTIDKPEIMIKYGYSFTNIWGDRCSVPTTKIHYIPWVVRGRGHN